MSKVPSFSEASLEAICNVLGDTSEGLTGSEIGRLLRQCGIADPYPGDTKRHRLREALLNRQRQDRCGNTVVAFLHAAMDPVRYTDEAGTFEQLRHRLNKALAFAGLTLTERGRLARISAARTLDGAEERAHRLRGQLERRNVHTDVLGFCRPELVAEDYFHAVLEATKSVADKVRQKAGLRSDG